MKKKLINAIMVAAGISMIVTPSFAFADSGVKSDSKAEPKVEHKEGETKAKKPANKEEAKARLDEANKAVNAAKAELDAKAEAEKSSADKLKAKTDKKAELEKSLKAENQKAEAAIASEKQLAKEALDKINAQIAALNKEIEGAKAELDLATAAKNQANNEFVAKKEAYEAAAEANPNGEAGVDGAKEAYEAALKSRSDKEGEVSAKGTELEGANVELDSKTAALTKTEGALAAKDAEVGGIESALTEKTAAKTEAEGKLAEAEKNPQVKKVSDDVDAAKEDVASKTATHEAAETENSQLKGQVEVAKTADSKAASDLKNAQAEASSKADEIKASEAKVANLTDEASKADEALKAARASSKAGEIEAKEAEGADLDAKVKAAEKKIADAQAAIKALEKAKADAEEIIKEADKARDAQLAQGSVGFFKAEGSVNASKVFENKSWYTKFNEVLFDSLGEIPEDKMYVESQTEIGNDKDATSLRNMYTALEFLKVHEQLTKEEGLTPKKVTDNLMAVSQRNANWSKLVVNHFLNTDAVANYKNFERAEGFDPAIFGVDFPSENLAWGYPAINTGNLKDEALKDKKTNVVKIGADGHDVIVSDYAYRHSPYYGWYYTERCALWVQEIKEKKDLNGDGKIGPIEGYTKEEAEKLQEDGQIGHYKLLISDEYDLTGFAVTDLNPKNYYANTVIQEFAESSKLPKDAETNVPKDPGNKGYTVDEYKARLDAYVNGVKETCENKKAAPKATIADADSKLAENNKTIKEQTAFLEDLKAKKAQAEKDLAALRKAEEQVTAKVAELETKKTEADSKLEAAKAEQTKLNGEKTALDGKVAQLKTAKDQAKAELDRISGEYEASNGRLQEAKTNLETAKADLAAKEEVLNNLNAEVTKLKTAIEELNKEIKDLTEKAEAAKAEKTALEGQAAKDKAAKKTAQAKVTSLEEAKATLEGELASLKNDEATKKSAYESLKEANKDLLAAKAAYDEASKNLENAKAKETKAQQKKAELDGKLEAAKAEKTKAEARNNKASQVTWKEEKTEDFAPVNEFTQKVKAIKEQLAAIEGELPALTEAQKTAKAELDKAEKAYNKALANQAIAKADYNEFVPQGGGGGAIGGGGAGGGDAAEGGDAAGGEAEIPTNSDVLNALAITGTWHKDGSGAWTFTAQDGKLVKNAIVKVGGSTYSFDKDGKMKTGWEKSGKVWNYFTRAGEGTEGAMVINRWKKVGNNWYFFEKDGTMAADKMVGKYYVNKNGAWRTDKWVKSSNGKWWLYNKEGGYPKNEFKVVNGNKYYFDNGGWMTTGWLKDKGTWFYFNKNGQGTEGAMAINRWKKVGNNWYFFEKDGTMAADKMVGKYYVNKNGAWRTDKWVKSSNGKWWFYNKEGGYPKNENKTINGNEYYFDNGGWMKTGWLYDKGEWFYFNQRGNGTEGAMAKNTWKKVNGKWYYFYEDGRMAKNTVVNGYRVDGSGAWIK